MNNQTISIIIPVYKVEDYLERCMNSVLNQTYRNLEILLVDDGSPDRCPLICEEYAKKDPRVNVIHKVNGGSSSARNAGLDCAAGDYVLFLDSDDYIENDMCENLLRGTAEGDVVICGVFMDGIGNGRFPAEPLDTVISSQELTEWLLFGKMVKSWAVNKLLPRRLIGDSRFDESVKYQEDVAFFLRLFSANECRIKFIPYYGYHYVIRNGSLTGMLENRISSYEFINSNVLSSLEETPGLKYRRVTLYMNECRVFALRGYTKDDRRMIDRNIAYIRENLKEVSPFLNKSQKRRCNLLSLNFRLFVAAETMNFKMKQRRGLS